MDSSGTMYIVLRLLQYQMYSCDYIELISQVGSQHHHHTNTNHISWPCLRETRALHNSRTCLMNTSLKMATMLMWKWERESIRMLVG